LTFSSLEAGIIQTYVYMLLLTKTEHCIMC